MSRLARLGYGAVVRRLVFTPGGAAGAGKNRTEPNLVDSRRRRRRLLLLFLVRDRPNRRRGWGWVSSALDGDGTPCLGSAAASPGIVTFRSCSCFGDGEWERKAGGEQA